MRVWTLVTEDRSLGKIRINMRSRGPIINQIAIRYSGGGHPLAAAVKVESMEIAKRVLDELSACCKISNM